MKKMIAPYRILTANNCIKYAGTDFPSWLTLEMAYKLVNRDAGERIYEFNYNHDKLWEVL